MLVLTRKVGESLIIDEKIEVTVLSVEGDKVKLGIVAPRDIPILRKELHQAILEQNMIEARLVSGPEPDTFQKLRDILLSEMDGNTPKMDDDTRPDSDSKDQEKKD